MTTNPTYSSRVANWLQCWYYQRTGQTLPDAVLLELLAGMRDGKCVMFTSAQPKRIRRRANTLVQA